MQDIKLHSVTSVRVLELDSLAKDKLEEISAI